MRSNIASVDFCSEILGLCVPRCLHIPYGTYLGRYVCIYHLDDGVRAKESLNCKESKKRKESKAVEKY